MNLTSKTVLDGGKYVVHTQLSQGVFGVTYKATDTESGQTVVIKTLGESLREHPDFDQFKQQFLEIGDRISRCNHPNLVRVLACFEEARRPYLVMDYIPGQTLADFVQSNRLPPGKAIKYIRQISSALSILHKAGLLHRDVKPQNIIRRPDTDSVVLCEFGIACEFTPGVMQTHASLLCAGYAPLEQYSYEERRTPATDIYALAATFYDLLTGNPPLPAPVRQTLYGDGGVSAATVSDLEPTLHNVPPAIKQAIYQGLELAAERRPQTVNAWLSLLPKPKPSPKTQPAPAQHSAAKPTASKGATSRQNSVQANAKPASKQRETLELPTPEGRSKPVGDVQTISPRPRVPASPCQSHPTTYDHTPTPGQSPTPQPKLDRYLVQVNTKPASQKGETPNPRTEKNPTPQPAKVQHSVTKTQGRTKGTISVKHKILAVGLPLQALLVTGAIAASAGVGFGFALRINRPNEPGSTLLHTKQSFPPRSDWPVSEPQL